MTISAHTPDASTVVLTAAVDAEPARVYAAFTETGSLSTWFWPPRLEPTYAVDATVGGSLRARSDVIDLGVTGTFRELVPDQRIALDWQWDGAEDVTTVLLDLVPSGAGTTLTLTHTANPTEAARDEHRAGWTDCLSRLEASFGPQSY